MVITSDKSELLNSLRTPDGGPEVVFDRLLAEYRAANDDGKKELFLALASDFAVSQVAQRALAKAG